MVTDHDRGEEWAVDWDGPFTARLCGDLVYVVSYQGDQLAILDAVDGTTLHKVTLDEASQDGVLRVGEDYLSIETATGWLVLSS